MVYFSILFGFLAVAGLGLGLRNRSRWWSLVLLVLGCAGCCSLVAWQAYATFLPGPESLSDRPLAAAGYFLGHEVSRELAGRNGDILLIDGQRTGFHKSAEDSLSTTFARVLLPMRGLQILHVNLTKVTTSDRRPIGDLAMFERVFAAHPNTIAYVSLVGAPAGIERSSFLEQSRIPLFVFDLDGNTNWVSALTKGLIRAVIVPRPDMRPRSGERIAGAPDEIFQRFYLLAKPGTAVTIADQLGRRQKRESGNEPAL